MTSNANSMMFNYNIIKLSACKYMYGATSVYIHAHVVVYDHCHNYSPYICTCMQVLHGLDLRVDVGQTIALVGSSGSGKSTVVDLVQRFYEADSGEVCVCVCVCERERGRGAVCVYTNV